MAKSKDELLAVLARTMDEGWLAGLMADPDSEAILAAMATVWERVSLAAQRGSDAGLISLAPGGSPGTSFVTLTRGADGATNTVIPKGALLSDSRGVMAATTSDVPVATTDRQVVLHVATLRQTELVNTVEDPGWKFEPSALVADASNSFNIVVHTRTPYGAGSEGLVRVSGVLGNTAANVVRGIDVVISDTRFIFLGLTGNGDYAGGGLVQPAPAYGMVVQSASPIEGGTSDFLRAHGHERGQERQTGEATGPYRLRVRNIPDAVAPIGLANAVQGAAAQAGFPEVQILEPFKDGATPATKANYLLGDFQPVYGSGIFPLPGSPEEDFFDDAGLGREIVGLREASAYFRIVGQGPLAEPDGSVMHYDVGAFFDDPVWGYPDVGLHPVLRSALMAVWEEAHRKKAAGVQFDYYVDDVVRQIGAGAVQAVGVAGAWTLLPPLGKLWYLRDGLADHDAPLPLDPTANFHRVVFTFEDSTTFHTPVWGQLGTERLNLGRMSTLGFPYEKRIASIQGQVVSDGVQLINMVGTFFLTEVAV